MPYGPEWRKHRRMLTNKFGPNNVQIFDPVQEFVSCLLVERLLEDPRDLDSHCRLCVPFAHAFTSFITNDSHAHGYRHAGQSILMSVYGVLVESTEHDFVKNAEVVMNAISDTLRPGGVLMDALPFCTCSMPGDKH